MEYGERGVENAEQEKQMNYKKVFEQGLESLRTLSFNQVPAERESLSKLNKDK